VRREDKGEDKKQPEPALSRLRRVQAAQLVQHRTAVESVLHVAHQVLDGFAIDHHARDALEKLLHSDVV